jgi:hypothetical protein
VSENIPRLRIGQEDKMKQGLALAAVVAAGLYATGAWSAAQQTPVEKKLQKDVTVLKAQVKALQANVKKAKTLASDAQDIALGVLVLDACSTALTADGLQGTWQVIDQFSAATQAGKTYFGPQTPVSDAIGGQPICQLINVPRSQALPPTVAPFRALLGLFQTP